MKRKPKLDVMMATESITDRFEQSIATANLLSVAKFGEEIADTTIPHAAFHLYRDLEKLKGDVLDLIEVIETGKATAGAET